MAVLNDRNEPVRGGRVVDIAVADDDLSIGAAGTKGVRGIYCGGQGDLKVLTVDGSILTFVGVLDCSIVPVHARKIFKIGTNTSSMIALW